MKNNFKYLVTVLVSLLFLTACEEDLLVYEPESSYAQLASSTASTMSESATTGKTIKVYERKRGSKIQLFTITNNGQCLGRVWDSRKRKRGVVVAIDNGCKFPLGNWKEGETRDFFSAYNWPKKKSGGSSTSKRTGMKKTLTIKKLGDEKKTFAKPTWFTNQS